MPRPVTLSLCRRKLPAMAIDNDVSTIEIAKAAIDTATVIIDTAVTFIIIATTAIV